jgi:phosphoinositide-3-kinase regulatory subunit 4
MDLVLTSRLQDLARLCQFFGRQKTNEFLLPLASTFLNQPDWQLRAAFFRNIVGVSAFVGASSLETFILPLAEDAITSTR